MIKRIIKILIVVLLLCLITGVGLFLYNANQSYNINNSFKYISLNYNPDDSSSTYNWNGTDITVYNGFVKGIQKGEQPDSIVIRALSPLPTIDIKSNNKSNETIFITVENINPDYYSKMIDKSYKPSRIAVNTLKFDISLNAGEEKKIEPGTPSVDDSNKYIVLGDNRDGYDTFNNMINQINPMTPIFVIDNGDLVFSGKPNQYRLFDQTVSKISTTLCTTLGNHDIRSNGRVIYTKLYGPAYYSFDFGNNHFVFLDSSRGYLEKPAIPEEEYVWLENDLQKVQGKNIFVISHIPPTDPRSNVTPNKLPNYIDKLENDQGAIENFLDNFNENANFDHGFTDKQEAIKFENIMAKNNVKVVYLSHIHSYFDYYKDSVHYIISGGGGAELLSEDSYYHYLIVKMDKQNTYTMVEMPSPANTYISRYLATASLFIQAMYKENTVAVIIFTVGLVLLCLLILMLIVMKLSQKKLWALFKDTGKYMGKRFKKLYIKKKN